MTSPVTARDPVATAPLVAPAVGELAVTAIVPVAGCDCRMLVEVPVDVLPSDPRTTPPIGAVSKAPYDGALDAGAGTAAIG